MFFETFSILFWENRKFIIFISRNHFFYENLCAKKPLMTYDIFYTRITMHTKSYLFSAEFLRYEVSFCTNKFYDVRSSLTRCYLSGKYTCLLFHFSFSINNHSIRIEMVILCDSVTPSIMSWCDSHNTSTEIHIDSRIRNNRYLTVQNRDERLFPKDFLIAFIFWMDGQSFIREKCFWSCRHDHYFFVRS